MLGTLVQELQQTEEGRLRRFFLRRFRNRADAADATQETFLRLLASAQRSLRTRKPIYSGPREISRLTRSVCNSVALRSNVRSPMRRPFSTFPAMRRPRKWR